MEIAKKRSFLAKSTNVIPTLFRYMRFISYNNYVMNNSNLQMSRIELIDQNGNQYQWPTSGIIGTSTDITGNIYVDTIPQGENTLRLFDHNVNTKLCTNPLIFPCYFTFDFSSEILDLNTYVKWQWWTANDNVSQSQRTPNTFAIEFSVDGEKWYRFDYHENLKSTWTVQNYALAYEGELHYIPTN